MRISLKYFIVCFLFLASSIYSQSMTGLSGLYSIPTANIIGDGDISVGTNYFPKQKLDFLGENKGAQTYYLSLGYLPFFEFGLRLTRPYGEKGEGFAIGDRMFSARIKFLNESDVLPAIAIGFHDFTAANGGEKAKRFNANYITLTKSIPIDNIIDNIAVTAGYGIKLREADDYEFMGLFGGASITFLENIQFILEYDSDYTNSAIKLNVLNHFNLLFGLYRLKYPSGGLSFTFSL